MASSSKKQKQEGIPPDEVQRTDEAEQHGLVSNLDNHTAPPDQATNAVCENTRSEADPDTPTDEELPEVSFKLHTRGYPGGRIVTDAIWKEVFVAGRHTVILIHGYTGNEGSEVIAGGVRALLTLVEQTDGTGPKALLYNIVSATWKDKAWTATYLPSRFWVNHVADEIFGFLKELIDRKINTAEEIILVGHSLGAQIAGIAGKYFFNYYKEKIALIYAVDAAGVAFAAASTKDKLAPDDAVHVVALHATTLLGDPEECGRSNTYLNWGEPSIPLVPHVIAAKVFNQTIYNPEKYRGVRRDTSNGEQRGEEVVRIGWGQPSSVHGVFYATIDEDDLNSPQESGSEESTSDDEQ